MRKGHPANVCNVHLEEILPHSSLDLHRRTAPPPFDAPVGPHENKLSGMEELELLRMRTKVAQDRAQLRPRRIADAEVLTILHLYRDR
jgi:hypothetical protein